MKTIYLQSILTYHARTTASLIKELKRERHKEETEELKNKRLCILEELFTRDGQFPKTKENIDQLYETSFKQKKSRGIKKNKNKKNK